MNTKPNPQTANDEYAHLDWADHPDNPANYPDMADFPQRPLKDDEISWEEAYLTGAEVMTQSEFEALTGLDDVETDTTDHT